MKRRINKYTFTCFALFTALFAACVSYQGSISNQNMAALYNPAITYLHPQYEVSHQRDSSTMLLVKFFVDELLFNMANPTKTYKAQLKIHYELFASLEKGELLDTGSVRYLIDRSNAQNEIISYIPLKTPTKGRFFLRITTTDLVRNSRAQTVIELDKTNTYNGQYYSLTSLETKSPMFRNYTNSKESVYLNHNPTSATNLFLSYYPDELPMALPPFSKNPPFTMPNKPQSLKLVQLVDTVGIRLDKYGLYYFQVDTAIKTGLSVMNFGEAYPNINTAEQMIEPLRYITKTAEYQELRSAKNKKLALDNFWLAITNNLVRAKELIRVYYSRALFANIYFTSFGEGWKTDRGMIFIVFGPPGSVYKTDNTEKWIYGENANRKPIVFQFRKMENLYSDNHFVLIRNPKSEGIWMQAVSEWRKGRAFSITN